MSQPTRDNHRRWHRRRFQRRIPAAGGLPRDAHRPAAAGRRLFLRQCGRHRLLPRSCRTIHPRILLKIPGWLHGSAGASDHPVVLSAEGLAVVSGGGAQCHAGAGQGHHRSARQSGAAGGERILKPCSGDAGSTDLLKYEDTLRLYDNEQQFRRKRMSARSRKPMAMR